MCPPLSGEGVEKGSGWARVGVGAWVVVVVVVEGEVRDQYAAYGSPPRVRRSRGGRLCNCHRLIYAQVQYAIKEYACTAIDVIAWRARQGLLNVQAADEALPRIVDIMAKELVWSKQRKMVRMCNNHSSTPCVLTAVTKTSRQTLLLYTHK